MSTNAPTVADPTHVDRKSASGARLMFYVEGDDGLSSQVVSLPEGVEVTLGRSRGCTVTVESERISRRHLSIVRNGDAVVVTDLGSRNGTRVNGVLVTEPTPLVPGDEITVRPVSIVMTTVGEKKWRRRLSDAASFHERLRAEADRGTRYKRQFALAMLRFEGSEALADEAIERLSGRMRSMDVLGDYGANEVAVLLPELDRAGAGAALERIVDIVSATGIILRVGIASFPSNGTQPDALVSAARAALRLARASGRRDVVVAEDVPKAPAHVVAEAPATRQMFELIEKIAPSTMTVLIVGETGAGKEIAAQAIHDRSRPGGPFVALNCAALPSTLLESELFGHERGAFTGADAQKTGFFEAANGGTLFLDEIGEMEVGLQAKILRVLESRKVIRVGGTRPIPVDVRVVCATNRDLSEEAKSGRFRSDLFYRIAGFTLAVPPLRERAADILPMAERFMGEVSAELGAHAPVLSPAAKGAFLAYGWPGNVRELRNAVERATVLAGGGTVELADLPDDIALSAQRGDQTSAPRNHLEDVERDAIVRALEASGGNQTHAARRLGLTRRALIYRMEKHGLKDKPR